MAAVPATYRARVPTPRLVGRCCDCCGGARPDVGAGRMDVAAVAIELFPKEAPEYVVCGAAADNAAAVFATTAPTVILRAPGNDTAPVLPEFTLGTPTDRPSMALADIDPEELWCTLLSLATTIWWWSLRLTADWPPKPDEVDACVPR